MVQNSLILRHQNLYFLQAWEWVSKRVNEWAQQSVQVKWAVWSKQMSERYEQTSKQVSEWPSIYVFIFD